MNPSLFDGPDAAAREGVRRLIDRCSVPTFDDFWQAWPRREAKKDARRAWDKLRAASKAAALAALPMHVDRWRREGRARIHIPHPATWLNGERWEDEFEPIEGITDTPRSRGSVTPVAAPAKPWPCTSTGITEKGTELGITQNEGELFPYFKARVFAAAGLSDVDRSRILADYGMRV